MSRVRSLVLVLSMMLTACGDGGLSRSTATDEAELEAEGSTGAESAGRETRASEPAADEATPPDDEAGSVGEPTTSEELCATATEEDIPVTHLEHPGEDATQFQCPRCGVRYHLPHRIDQPARMRCRRCCSRMLLNAPAS